ncbi:hypothetical protein, partial [Shinella sp. BE166]|uniref:hypothetical protein n=1 Tax=Shinella sp. BE166 TaxID=3373918 RepID=UPI003EB79CEC
PSLTALGEGSHGSILNGNYAPNRLSSAWKPTPAAIADFLRFFGWLDVSAEDIGQRHCWYFAPSSE